MIVCFFRHANAGQEKVNPTLDKKRPLDSEGIEQCLQMAGKLRASIGLLVARAVRREGAAVRAVFCGCSGAAVVAERCPETLRPAGGPQSSAQQEQVAQRAEREHLRGVLFDSQKSRTPRLLRVPLKASRHRQCPLSHRLQNLSTHSKH